MPSRDLVRTRCGSRKGGGEVKILFQIKVEELAVLRMWRKGTNPGESWVFSLNWLEKRFLQWDVRERCSPAPRSVSAAVAMCQAVGETRGTLSQNLCECIPTSLQDQVLLRKGGVLTQIWKILALSNYFYFPYVTLWNITLFLNLSKCLSFAEVGKPFIK